jgi:hypothetical protein
LEEAETLGAKMMGLGMNDAAVSRDTAPDKSVYFRTGHCLFITTSQREIKIRRNRELTKR